MIFRARVLTCFSEMIFSEFFLLCFADFLQAMVELLTTAFAYDHPYPFLLLEFFSPDPAFLLVLHRHETGFGW